MNQECFHCKHTSALHSLELTVCTVASCECKGFGIPKADKNNPRLYIPNFPEREEPESKLKPGRVILAIIFSPLMLLGMVISSLWEVVNERRKK